MIEGSGVENNAYATLDVFADDTLHLTGYRRQSSLVIHRDKEGEPEDTASSTKQ